MTLSWTTTRKNVVRHYEVSLIRRFGHVTIRSNDFRQFFFRQNNDSAKLHSGKMTIRSNDISRKWCGPNNSTNFFKTLEHRNGISTSHQYSDLEFASMNLVNFFYTSYTDDSSIPDFSVITEIYWNYFFHSGLLILHSDLRPQWCLFQNNRITKYTTDSLLCSLFLLLSIMELVQHSVDLIMTDSH